MLKIDIPKKNTAFLHTGINAVDEWRCREEIITDEINHCHDAFRWKLTCEKLERLAWSCCMDVWPSCRPLAVAVFLSSERSCFRTVSSPACCRTPERRRWSGPWGSWTSTVPRCSATVRGPPVGAAGAVSRAVLPSSTTTTTTGVSRGRRTAA